MYANDGTGNYQMHEWLVRTDAQANDLYGVRIKANRAFDKIMITAPYHVNTSANSSPPQGAVYIFEKADANSLWKQTDLLMYNGEEQSTSTQPLGMVFASMSDDGTVVAASRSFWTSNNLLQTGQVNVWNLPKTTMNAPYSLAVPTPALYAGPLYGVKSLDLLMYEMDGGTFVYSSAYLVEKNVFLSLGETNSTCPFEETCYATLYTSHPSVYASIYVLDEDAKLSNLTWNNYILQNKQTKEQYGTALSYLSVPTTQNLTITYSS